ncbi:hypothetical protein [Nonomuraea dietziae]
MAKRLRVALGAMVVAGMAAGCGALPLAQPAPAGSPPQASPSPAKAAPSRKAVPSEKAVEAAAFEVPADPCRVLTARTRSRLGMAKSVKDKYDVACKWANDPGDAPPFRFRDLKVTYDAGFKGMTSTEQDARRSFASKRRNDYRQPSVFGGAPSVKGTIGQVGSAKAGEHFDEGYYVYYVYQVGGAKRGEGRAVLRKGNVVVTINASGADVPGRRVRDGRPLGNDAVQAMIDAVAGQVIAAVR